MTEKGAIEFLQENVPKCCKMVDGRYQGGFDDWDCDMGKAIRVAVLALQDIQQYREIGSVAECRAAVEKRKSLKPEFLYMLNDTRYKVRCKCGRIFVADIHIQGNPKFCPECGVKFDWSEEE